MSAKPLHVGRRFLEQWARAEESQRAAHEALMSMPYTAHHVDDEYVFAVPEEDVALVQLQLELLQRQARRGWAAGPRGTVQDIGYIPPVLRAP